MWSALIQHDGKNMQGYDRELSYFKAIVCCTADNKASQRFNTAQWPFKQEGEDEIVCGHVLYHSSDFFGLSL